MIEIRNETKKYRVSLSKLKHLTEKILKELKCKQAGLNVLLVGDRKIQRINRRYLKHNRPTDVIAFSQMEGKRINAGKGPAYLGDLVISLDTTARQAQEYGNRFDYELAFYLCHGILHLMGHDDSTVKKAAAMDRKQKQVLKAIGVH